MLAAPILDALKLQTQQLHVQLEAHLNLLDRLQSPETYRRLLAAFFGFYSPMEARLAECTGLKQAGLDFEHRRKVPLLVTDFQHWNVAVNTLPQASDLPQITSAAAGLGCLYVLEGATLGSQIIKRLLVQKLAISAENGGAFFNAYGDQVIDMWQAFRQTLSQYSSSHPHEQDAMIAAAQDTFLKLDAWFTRCLD